MFVSSTLRSVCSLFRCAFRGFFAVRSSPRFRLLLRCLVLASLLRCFFLLSFVASPTVDLFSLPFSLSSWGVACCSLSRLYLVLVQYSHVSFFSLGVCFFFFSFFGVGSGLFCLLSTLCSPSSLWWLFPAQVPGFRFHLLVLFCFRIHWVLLFSLFCVFASVSSSSHLLGSSARGPSVRIRLSVAPTFLCHPSLSYLAFGFAFFIFPFPPSLLFFMWFRFHFSAFFLVFPCVFSRSSVRVSLRLSFFLHPLSDHLLLLGASLSTLWFICYGRLSFLLFYFCVHRSRLRCFVS